MNYKTAQTEEIKVLDVGSYFSSTGQTSHDISNSDESEIILYVRTSGNIKISELK